MRDHKDIMVIFCIFLGSLYIKFDKLHLKVIMAYNLVINSEKGEDSGLRIFWNFKYLCYIIQIYVVLNSTLNPKPPQNTNYCFACKCAVFYIKNAFIQQFQNIL